MGKWIKIITIWTDILPALKRAVEDAFDQAKYLGLDELGILEMRSGKDSYYVIRKDDFEEWFGD